MKLTQEQKKAASEMAWAEVFIKYFNKKYGFDYVASSIIGVPATDIVAESQSGDFPSLKIELTEAKRLDDPIKDGVKIFDNDNVSSAIEKKEIKYEEAGVNINDVVLLVQGHLTKDWMEDVVIGLRSRYQNSCFMGIYYVCPGGLEESSFVMEIKSLTREP